MNDLDSINKEQRLYVIKCGTGFSCLGFDVAFNRASAMAAWSGVHLPNPEWKGTELGYADYCRCLDAASKKSLRIQKVCPCELTPQLMGLERHRVEVVDAYGQKRRFKVGKSTGWMPCHLELFNERSTGGPAVMGAPFKSVRVVK